MLPPALLLVCITMLWCVLLVLGLHASGLFAAFLVSMP